MDNKISKKTILILIFMIIGVIIAGTFAWLSFRSKDTAMVLTVGQIDNVRITLSPYQIKSNMGSVLDYSSGTVTNIEAINNSSSSKKFKLYYKINTIDSNLAISSFKYTITRSSTKNGTYSIYGTEGNFNGATSNSEKIILEETLSSNETYYYKVYIWLDGNSNVSSAQGKTFNAELRADILGHTVTFDANGGTVNISSKEVTTGLEYGELPTPTRKGYKFLGWNGKNLFDSSKLSTLKDWEYNGNYYAGKQSNFRILLINKDEFKLNTQYTINYDIYVESGTNIRFQIFYTDGTVVYTPLYSTSEWKNIIAITQAGKTVRYLQADYSSDGIVRYKNFQLEEGTEATVYEPYYITSDTIVVQDQDHTLTAIWEEANPVVTLNANGGTIPATTGWTVNGSTATKQIGYNDVYGNLPMPTRSGYTFLGWHGKNLFDGIWENGAINTNNGSDSYGASIRTSYIMLEPNKNYYFSLPPNHNYFPITYKSDKTFSRYLGLKIRDFTFSTNNEEVYLRVMQYNETTIPQNVQLEEGTEATPYEPYYISSNTTVVQENNHTLTAMWQAN